MARKQLLKRAIFSINELAKHPTALSFKTKADYQKIVKMAVHDLHQLNVPLSNIHDLKKKHVERLVEHWQKSDINLRTLHNRLSALRYTTNLIKKGNIVSSDNSAYGLGRAQRRTTHNKAIDTLVLDETVNPYIAYSLKLQQAFGLRREESIKIIPEQADKKDYLLLKSSWTKGGIERRIPILTEQQKQLIKHLKQYVPKGGALIPPHKSYIQQENTYVSETRRLGIRNPHGLRHAYAQRRYQILTRCRSHPEGMKCPLQGGKLFYQMSEEEQQADQKARLLLSNELGHSRVGITRIYCG